MLIFPLPVCMYSTIYLLGDAVGCYLGFVIRSPEYPGARRGEISLEAFFLRDAKSSQYAGEPMADDVHPCHNLEL